MVEMEVIVTVKEEDVMPENWRPASEMRALVTSHDNSVIHNMMDDAMEAIQKEAKNGSTFCYIIRYCKVTIADAFMEILTALGYKVSMKNPGGKYTFEIHW
jgi:hypothetical protein